MLKILKRANSDDPNGIFIQAKDVFVKVTFLEKGDTSSSSDAGGVPRIRVAIYQDSEPNNEASDNVHCIKYEDFLWPYNGFELHRVKMRNEK